jgi:uracil-DNA glycosylase
VAAKTVSSSTVQIASSVREMLKQVNSLAELKQLMENFDGCELKKTANKMVFGDGNPESKIMLIGEAPGADEDKIGLPFVGPSGKLLDQMFSCIGLTRANYYITNIIPWRPPGNRDPTAEEREICLPFVERRIELIQPKVIVMVGGVAAKSLLNIATGITGIRGQWQPYKTPGMTNTIDTFAIYHPSYLLRSPGQKRVVWKDLLILKQKLQEQGLL